MSALLALPAAIARLTGFSIEMRRAGMLADRLAPVMRSHGFRDSGELAARLHPNGDAKLIAAVIEAVVINETLFFRDRSPFEALRTSVLPRLIEARVGSRRLRLWSAACSTGQEPYSLAMLLDEQARALAGWSVDLVATDISRAALETARAGVYSHFEVQRGLSVQHLLRHFRRVDGGWEISEPLRAAVAFWQRNLLDDLRPLGAFDVICCRNVLMYMDIERRRAILGRLGDMLASDGVLVLGAAETIIGLTDAFEPVPGQASLFTKRRLAARAA